MYVLNRSVTGYRKRLKGKACEDAVASCEYNDHTIMACADGHGDRRCLYAARGAELSVQTAIRVLHKYYFKEAGIEAYGKALNDEREQIAKDIVCEWTGAVLEDYHNTHPEDVEFSARFNTLYNYSKRIYSVREGEITADEFQRLAARRDRYEKDIYKKTFLYGTTLNAMVVTDKFVFAIGIGDGDVVAVNGKRVEWLLPRSGQFDSSTNSLCQNFSYMLESFMARYVPVTSGRKLTDSRFKPDLVMISTDGLRNSFLSDEEFADMISDIAAAFKSGSGMTFVRQSRQWIDERSEYGPTQDDISFTLCTKYLPAAKRQNAAKSKMPKKRTT